MIRALLLADSVADLARRAEPVLFIPLEGALVRTAIDDVTAQLPDAPTPGNPYHCTGCDARIDGAIELFLHMVGCPQYHRVVEPSATEPF